MISKKATILAIFLVGLLAVGIASAADNSTNDVACLDYTIDDAISVENNGADDTANAAENENGVRGSSINDDESTNTVNEKIALDCSSEESDVSNDSNVVENDKEILQAANSKTIYVNSSVSDNGDGSEDSPFQNLKDAVDAATDGDTIMIASGEYKGENNSYKLSIKKSLNFIKYGDGEAIFDGEKQNKIWLIYGSTSNRLCVNVRGLTFINGKSTGQGGAIDFYHSGGSITDCTFTNCTTAFNGNFDGGAIIFQHDDVGTITNCTFINNAANIFAGAVCLKMVL